MPVGQAPSFVFSHAGVAILGGLERTVALDAQTGRVLWKDPTDAMAAAFRGSDVVYGGLSGTLTARSLRSGTPHWTSGRICRAVPGDRLSGVFAISIIGANVVVGCEGGRVARMLVATGVILARADGFPVQRVSQIIDLGSCAYGVSGFSSGAGLMQHSEIVRCTSLAPIMPPRDDTRILGNVGHMALLDDICCFGRMDEYRPATILRVNLQNGNVLPEVDAAPEPQRHPKGTLPVDAETFLSDGSLYIAVNDRLYWYGDALTMNDPIHMIADDLVRPPTMLPRGLFALHRRYGDGSSEIQMVRLRGANIEIVWTMAAQRWMGVSYEPEIPGFLSLGGGAYARVKDGASVALPRRCRAYATTKSMVIATCSTTTLIGHFYKEYVAGFPWRK